MSRYLLALLFSIAAASAHAITPARQDANGSAAQCPPAEIDDAEAAPTDLPLPETGAPAKVPQAAQAKGGGLAQPKAGARWHSFLPGMFK